MANSHLLTSKPENLRWGAFSSEFEPVLEVESGDQVTIETVSGGPGQIPDEAMGKLLPDHAAFIASHEPILPGHIM
ncbi:MAG: amidase, partial [Alphaproteobacteria bacterium]